ncbi:MAG: UPF0280 family protein [Stappiaceae bacterium]
MLATPTDMESAQAHLLADGKRLHLHHGPIDLIIEAFGADRDAAYRSAAQRFETILTELVGELPLLRERAVSNRTFAGAVARRMQKAVEPFCAQFVTPMAAVAGSVADEILAAIQNVPEMRKAYVNNGGDVAFHLCEGETINAAISGLPHGRITMDFTQPFRGIATSGWRGRSFSLGIADSVSVVAADAASADVAATMIANAVALEGCPRVKTSPADELSPDSDLGTMLVTIDVGELYPEEVDLALDQGAKVAQSLLNCGLIGGAVLQLHDEIRAVGLPADRQSYPNEIPARKLIDA